MILNGGAVLALLTFAAQLMLAERPNVQLVKYVTAAIASFCLGLIFAAPIYHVRYESSRRHEHPRTKAAPRCNEQAAVEPKRLKISAARLIELLTTLGETREYFVPTRMALPDDDLGADK